MKTILAALIVLSLAVAAGAQAHPAIPDVDRIRLAEAFRLSDAAGNRVWDHWDTAPFAILLVTPEWEFLIRHPKPGADFSPIGYDKLTSEDHTPQLQPLTNLL